MTQIKEKNQYQIYADLLGIDVNQIDDVWLELNNALFIELADGSAICINHSCNYEDDYGTTVYSNLKIKQPTLSDIDYNEFNYPVTKETALKVLEAYFESTWDTDNEYVAEDSYRQQVEADKAWEETCRDTAQWLATA